jgi:hypothetical protein
MLRIIVKQNWRACLVLCMVCAGLSAACLLKGEDTTYFGFASETSFGTRGISAYTYYFVWPKDQRETVARNEEFVAVLQNMGGGLPASTLPERERRNLILAILFGAASAGLAIALWVVKFSNAAIGT